MGPAQPSLATGQTTMRGGYPLVEGAYSSRLAACLSDAWASAR